MMIRIGIALVAATVAATGCGQAHSSTPQSQPRPYTHARQSTRPPAATLTSASGTRRLVTGSYCWTARMGSTSATGCADAAAPRLMPGMPRVQVRAGEMLVIRLGFTPTAPVDVSIGRTHHVLAAASVLRLRVRRGGLLRVDPRRGHDDVEYLARIVMPA